MVHPGMKLGPFSIVKELGAGAMGTVYLAKYKDNKTVAIKVMAPGIGTNETALARFEREASILKQLKHPNIVRLLATGRIRNSPFYAMEFIEGESLDHVMARRNRLSWEEVIELGKQLCAALQHAHEKGIVHRDLKPSNLMMLPDGTMKLTDFGIAKDLDETGLTATNCTVGTASYMSPEQCKGERNISSKSDLYSMGIMFYELVTGRKPFEAESTMDMFLQHVKGTFERPSRYCFELPIWFDTLICQLMEKKPEDRPLNAEMVGRTLDDILEKMEAQKSAGVERATMRNIDRKKNLQDKLDDDEKEIARALLRKKKKRKKVTPVYEKGWFVLLMLFLVLGGIGTGIYFVFLRAPSLESLHQTTAVYMKEVDFDKAGEALAGPIAQFDRYYAASDNPLAKEMTQWKDEALCLRRERQMHNRRKNFSPENDVEKTARLALDEEEAGRITDARDLWKKVASRVNDENLDMHAWGLVGAKNVLQINSILQDLQTLKDKIHADPLDEFKGNEGPQELAVKALRAEIKKENKQQASDAWEQLQKLTENEFSNRPWYLMATYKLRELKAES